MQVQEIDKGDSSLRNQGRESRRSWHPTCIYSVMNEQAGDKENPRTNRGRGHSTRFLCPLSYWVSLGFEVTGCLLFNAKQTNKSWRSSVTAYHPSSPRLEHKQHKASSQQRRHWVHTGGEFHCHCPQFAVCPDHSLEQGSRGVTQITTIWVFWVVKFVYLGPQKSPAISWSWLYVIEPVGSNKVCSAGETNRPALLYHILM